ncbi:MAG: 16S rRNA (uracil(1498)-N(3))-methyltransferase [Fimbriimonadaceae bacterium]|nr:16S rRNA (uracil(1498)-N(3))-methyltransferase [Fimbriimonadaceae bacterium]
MPKKGLPIRALPRFFIEGLDLSGPFEIPAEEFAKIHKVLRLSTGDEIAVLPNDGRLVRCEIQGRSAAPIETILPNSEPDIQVTLAQALPKGDRIDTIVRMCTEIGVARMVFFPAERSVVKWDDKKIEDRLRRMRAVTRESAEQCFRSRLPQVSFAPSLKTVLEEMNQAIVLSEREGLEKAFATTIRERISAGCREFTLVVGPEGGWAPRELALIGDRGVTLGPLVLRADTAGPVAAGVVLLGLGS